MMYSVLSITTKATPLSAVTMMWSLSFLRLSSATLLCFSDVCMYWFIGKSVRNSINIMVDTTSQSGIFSRKYLSIKFSGLPIRSSNKAEEGTSYVLKTFPRNNF